MDESQYTRAKAHPVPEPGPATTAAERLINSTDPVETARRDMAALRRR
jgi:hypothetical protein